MRRRAGDLKSEPAAQVQNVLFGAHFLILMVIAAE
jgi:hypothetical protein